MPKKITRFDEIIGNKNIVTFLQSHLDKGTLPNKIIFEGEEGLGKTSIAKLLAMGINCTGEHKPCYTCPSCRAIAKTVIEDNKNLDCVQIYNMSVDSGKEAAKLVKNNMSASMSSTGKRVIICDEAHGMSDAAQDVFLVDMEYLPKDVYLFFCTTNAQNLKKTLKSRSFPINLRRPKRNELIKLLTEIAAKNSLNVQGGAATLALIADWAECKPRKAINLLEGFGMNTAVSTAMVKEFVDYVEVEEVLPLLDALSGSLTAGLSYVQTCRINQSIVDMFSDILTIKVGGNCFKFSADDLLILRKKLGDIPTDRLILFLKTLTSSPTLTRAGLVNALLTAHPMREDVEVYKPSVLQDELVQKSEVPPPKVPSSATRVQTTSMDMLLRGASKVQKGPPTLDALIPKGED